MDTKASHRYNFSNNSNNSNSNEHLYSANDNKKRITPKT